MVFFVPIFLYLFGIYFIQDDRKSRILIVSLSTNSMMRSREREREILPSINVLLIDYLTFETFIFAKFSFICFPNEYSSRFGRYIYPSTSGKYFSTNFSSTFRSLFPLLESFQRLGKMMILDHFVFFVWEIHSLHSIHSIIY